VETNTYHRRLPSRLRSDQLPVMVPAPRTDVARRRRAMRGAEGWTGQSSASF
jgi:hypothetical protein